MKFWCKINKKIKILKKIKLICRKLKKNIKFNVNCINFQNLNTKIYKIVKSITKKK